MDLVHLRTVLRPHVLSLSNVNRHVDLPSVCQNLGLPFPDSGVSKRDKRSPKRSTHCRTEVSLPLRPVSCSSIHSRPVTGTSFRTSCGPIFRRRRSPRRSVGKSCALNNEDLYLDGRRFDELLDRLWVLDDDGAGMFGASLARTPYQDRSLRALIQQHVHKNPGDWSTENVFQEVGALDCSDTRFARFLEGLSSPDVRPDEVSQRRFVEVVNKIAT